MPLDPIVSLSVGLAEAPGSFAFVLGSGASRDAGVLTGLEVYWRAVGELYRLENATTETPDQDALTEWLNETDRQNLGYSGVLELLAPDQATRREYLAGNFEGIEPAATHERLADLTARGLIKVFITTNFDRLLEHALQSRGIEPVVVTCDADLVVAPSREHSACYVLKPHGDYLQQTIRNTPAELAELEPGMTTELQEVFDRYGLVVLGYSGSDEAITRIFAARNSRYGLYWVSRGELVEPARTIVEAAGGRGIVRAGSDEFLADLDLRLSVFEAQPTGLTPVAVCDQTTKLLERGSPVALAELLRRERREFEQRLEATMTAHRSEHPTIELAGAIYDELVPALERRLASLLPLVLYDEARFAEEVDGLGDFKSRQRPVGGYSFFSDLPDWCIWWLNFVIGAFATRMRRLGVLEALYAAEVPTYNGRVEPLVTPFENSAVDAIGKAATARNSEQRWLDPAWQALLEDTPRLQLLVERYPELASSDEDFKRSLVEYDFVFTCAWALLGRGAVGRWPIYSEQPSAFAMRLRTDAKLRTAVADIVGLSLEQFDAQAADAMQERIRPPGGGFSYMEAIEVLRPPTPPA